MPPCKIKTLLESNPQKSRFFVSGLVSVSVLHVVASVPPPGSAALGRAITILLIILFIIVILRILTILINSSMISTRA